ncbi:MAG: hypothetical protein OXI24_07790, partial [Candidatus Poribacteria bacterium]|nr:hypothetical protein [Candidatus Poribacteria bacterium]
MQKQISIGIFVLFLVLLTFLPRMLSLSAHWSSDESTWMLRSRTFIIALEQGRFADTLTAYHPGVTTTWLGGLAIRKAAGQRSISELFTQTDRFLTTQMLARLRFPIAVLSGALILITDIYQSYCYPRQAVASGR